MMLVCMWISLTLYPSFNVAHLYSLPFHDAAVQHPLEYLRRPLLPEVPVDAFDECAVSGVGQEIGENR